MFERMVSTSHDESAAKLALSAIKKILLDIRVEEANLESLSEELRQTILTKQDELLKDREKAKTLADESAAALAEYQEELAETLELKQKVTNQLDIISEIFNNPDIIKSIEAYNVPFAEGNWENLCRLAEMLQDSRE
ncbi:MAG: hypothetical protein ED559_02630 [Phycisphaera sp.]|nr:MAG: hypothetical protein ED559_02630 [Phycisphaera sp.]